MRLLHVLLALFLTSPAWAETPKDYDVKIDAPAAQVGKSTTATVNVRARAGFHVNELYPSSLTVKVPGGVEGPTGKIKPRKVEKAAATFEIPFTPRVAGPKQFTATARFAICDDANTQCIPRLEEITFTVATGSGG